MARNFRNSIAAGAYVTVGSYVLLERIASGGMADVFLAAKQSVSDIRTLFAIKVVRPDLAANEHFMKLFVDEARVMATVKHPNLVTLHDIIEQGGQYFIVMELLLGVDLRRVMKNKAVDRPEMPMEVAASIISQSVSALHSAHEARSIEGVPLNLVHRDISPHNLFLNSDGFVKLLDFGVAKSSNRQEHTQQGALKGKIPYLSPEQCAGEVEIDRRSDLFSMGVVMYEMLTGHRPFLGKNEFQVIKSIMTITPPAPNDLNAKVPERLSNLVMRALSKSRDRRFSTAQDIRDEIRNIARDENWKIDETGVAVFLRDCFPKLIIEQETRVSELVSEMGDVFEKTVSDRPLEQSGILEPAFDDLVPRFLDLGPDLTCLYHSHGAFSVAVIEGQMREAFNADDLVARSRGTIILDLHGVRRITSFGVREWLSFIQKLQAKVDRVILSRVSIALMNQFASIPALARDCEISSAATPRRCNACGHEFEQIIRTKVDADLSAVCPVCDSEDGVFDEDSAFLASVASEALDVAPRMREILEDLERGESEEKTGIEKRIADDRTELDVFEADDSTRWNRLLSGVEGDVRIWFAATAKLGSGWTQKFFREVRKASGDANISIWKLPLDVALDPHIVPLVRSREGIRICSSCSTSAKREYIPGSDGWSADCDSCGTVIFEVKAVPEPEVPDAKVVVPVKATEKPKTNWVFYFVVLLLVAVIVGNYLI